MTVAPPVRADNPACTTQACADCIARKQAALNRMDSVSTQIYNQTITSPDTSFIQNCIAGLSAPNFGFSFGLPSISGILQKLCQMAKQAVTSQIQSITGSTIGSFSGGSNMMSNSLGNGFGSGVSIPTNTQTVNSNTISSAINGTSPSSAPSPTSNSAYLNSAQTSAMNFLGN